MEKVGQIAFFGQLIRLTRASAVCLQLCCFCF